MNLADVIPNPEYRMCHARAIAAPRTVVWDELHRVTMSALPLGWMLEALRLLPARLSGRKQQPLAGRSFLDVTPIPILFSERPDVVISAGLSQAWRLMGGLTPPQLDAAALRAFAMYWFFIRPSSGAIRREVLRTVAHRAESQVA